jgi:uncharacterized membrane protein
MVKEILFRLRTENRHRTFLVLALFSAYCVGLQVFRVSYSGNRTYTFLIWNLFLAWIPFGVSTLMILFQDSLRSRLLIVVGLGIWLLFFPNAPYILTDLFHLRPKAPMPLWYDLGLIGSFALCGLFLGLFSLMDIQQFVTLRAGRFLGWATVLACLVLCCLGIYIGRFLRFNSWDLVLNPLSVASDLSQEVAGRRQPRTVGMIALYSGWLLFLYLSVRSLAHRKRA